jgi:hypothetical protein
MISGPGIGRSIYHSITINEAMILVKELLFDCELNYYKERMIEKIKEPNAG